MASPQSNTTPLGDDLFPALQKLTNLALPYLKEIILVSLALGPTQLLPNLRGSILADNVGLLIVLYALYSGWIPHSIFLNRNVGSERSGNLVTTVTADEFGSAFKTVWDRFGAYFKLAFIFSLACYIPIQYNVPPPFQPWLYCILTASVAVIGFFAPFSQFYGPLRFGWIKYSQYFTQIYNFLIHWLFYSSILLTFTPKLIPYLTLGLLVMSLVSWIAVYNEYHEELLIISNETADAVSRATLAAAAASEYASAAAQYERQLLDVVTSTRRDAILAKSVKITDFFNREAEAWAALSEIVDPVQQMVKKSKSSYEAVIDVQDEQDAEVDEDAPADDSDGSDGELGPLAGLVLDQSEKLEEQMIKARQAIVDYQEAKDQDEAARKDTESNANNAAEAAGRLLKKISNVTSAVFAGSTYADKTQRLAKQAIETATRGDIAPALRQVEAAKEAADLVVASKDELKKSMDEAHDILLDYLDVVKLQDHGDEEF